MAGSAAPEYHAEQKEYQAEFEALVSLKNSLSQKLERPESGIDELKEDHASVLLLIDLWLSASPEDLPWLYLVAKIYRHPSIELIRRQDVSLIHASRELIPRLKLTLEECGSAANFDTLINMDVKGLIQTKKRLDSLYEMFEKNRVLNPYHTMYDSCDLLLSETCMGRWELEWRKQTGESRLFLTEKYIRDISVPMNIRFNTALNHLDVCKTDFISRMKAWIDSALLAYRTASALLKQERPPMCEAEVLYLCVLFGAQVIGFFILIGIEHAQIGVFLWALIRTAELFFITFTILYLIRSVMRCFFKIELKIELRKEPSSKAKYQSMINDSEVLYNTLRLYYHTVCTDLNPAAPVYETSDAIMGFWEADLDLDRLRVITGMFRKWLLEYPLRKLFFDIIKRISFYSYAAVSFFKRFLSAEARPGHGVKPHEDPVHKKTDPRASRDFMAILKIFNTLKNKPKDPRIPGKR